MTPDLPIPEEAIEAACVAMNGGVRFAHHRERWEPEVRTIITAALPHLRKEALEEAAKMADWFAVGAVFPEEAYTRAFRQGCSALAHHIREIAEGDPS